MRWLYGNWRYKLVALAISLGLWLVSHGDTGVERSFDVPLEISGIPSDLVVIEQSVDEVNFRVAGTRASMNNLSRVRLVYPVSAQGAKEGVLSLDVEASALQVPRGATVVSRSPSHIDITLARKGSKAVEVRADLDGEPAAGYAIGVIEVDPPRVRISGPRSEVLRLNQVLTETIDISGAAGDIEREVRLSLGGRNVRLEDETRIRVRIRVVPAPSNEERETA